MIETDGSTRALMLKVTQLQNRVKELEQTERSLHETHITREAILDNIPDMAWLKDKEGRFLAVNEAFEKACGFSRERLLGKTDFDFWPQQVAERFRKDDEEVIRSGVRKRIEETLVREKPVKTWIETIKSPIFDGNGHVIGTTGISRDITDRKLAQACLEKSLEESRRLLAEAAKYVETLLPEPITTGPICTDWRFKPSAALGGDLFGYYRLDEDHFALYLVDVCGHGVSAALLSVSVINVLRSRTLKDTDFTQPDMVLSALNKAFPMEEQNDMYFTIWYGIYNKASRTLVYSGGGHPPALLATGLSEGSPRIEQLHAPNLFIGGMPDVTFEKRSVRLDGPCRLYVFSDGVYEIQGRDGSMWDFEGFVEFMSRMVASEQSVLEGLFSHVIDLNSSEDLDDDFSILEVLIP
ncbi:MAG: SpoIIE family protein phosphatase [Pseudomonadota bacterium]